MLDWPVERWSFSGLLVAIAFNAVAVFAAPIPVRFAEGFAHGYLALRDENGDRLADGELIQKSHGHVVDSRLVLRFKDGSLYDERVSFTQKQSLRYRVTSWFNVALHFRTLSISPWTEKAASTVS